MEFKEWLAAAEGAPLCEGPLDPHLVRRVVDGLWTWTKDTGRAAALQGGDTLRALQTLRRLLGTLLGGDRPGPEQLEAARRVILELPKVGVVIASLIAPVPGAFTGVLLAAVAIKKVFGFSILPLHFERAWMGPESFAGKWAVPRQVNGVPGGQPGELDPIS